MTPVTFFPYLKSNISLYFSFTICLITFLVFPWVSYASISEAVVKIYIVQNSHSYHNPWQMRGQVSTHGSGAIIEGNRIITNAHVIANHMFIQVRRAGTATKYTATVDSIDYESDLAILKVEDSKFFKDVKPLQFGTLAKVKDKVSVYGFPDGGDKLSITEGVVSRIDHISYAYSGTMLLACQIDASINSGNSGGPVIFEDKIVGIAFQNMGGDYENIGYMIPTPIVNHFLQDIKDKKVDGFPTLGILMQKLENPDMRRYYKVKGQSDGILVNKLYLHSPSHGILQPSDVILEINDIKIANDGTIEFRKGQRTYFGYIVNQKQIGDSLNLKILRDGVAKSVTITLDTPLSANRLVPFEHEKKPRYYIYGGVVFEPLTLNYLQEFGGGIDWASFAPVAMLEQYINGEKTIKQEEVVILVKVLADQSNVGFHEFANVIVTEVNDTPLKSFSHFIELIEKTKKEHVTLKTKSSLKIILNRDTVKAHSEGILKKYQINSHMKLVN